jgi:BirA family biotin operon repressor/biotin-[acetyl-CoA-carboxylase] ligase
MLKIADIEKRLGRPWTVDYRPEVASTNDVALELARAGAGQTLVLTEHQTAGRGRRGAVWTAPAESSVLCSLLLRTAPRKVHELAILTGVGAAKGLQRIAPVRIKWPNDLMLHDRKVGGILVETTPDAVVIGVGINCAVPTEAFPDDVRARAGSLDTLTGRAVRREEVLLALVGGLADAMAAVEAGGIIKVLYDWNTLNWLRRRPVRVSGPMGVVEGDGLFLDGRTLQFHVFKNYGVVSMPLASSVEAR